MSHHLDSPLAREDPRLDISDVYLFEGNSGTVFVMNVNPQSGAGGFHHEAMYEFNIDTSGDIIPDLAFRVTFSEMQDDEQTVTVCQLMGPAATDRMAKGAVIAQGKTGANLEAQGGIQAFAGSAGEPFYIEGRVVTAVKMAIAEGSALDLGDFDPSTATNLFGDTNVSTIVLEVPNDLLGKTINFWGTVALATDAGGWRQVQRAATPLINTLYDFTEIHVTPDTHADYNATDPVDDMKNYGAFVKEKTAAVVKANGTNSKPEQHAEKVAEQLFPDVLHYRVGSKAKFKVHKRNGRGLTESTPEVMFELILDKPVEMGLDAASASGELRDEFPYLSSPVSPLKKG